MSAEHSKNANPVYDIVARLRDHNDGDVDEAADMLEFFFGQMRMHSPHMGGDHSYRFISGGWPMTQCRGPNAVDAVRSAIRAIKRERDLSEYSDR